MEWMTLPLAVMAGLFALNNYSTVMASKRAAGQDAPDRGADVRASAWRATANGVRRWAYAVIFGAIGWGFLSAPATAGRDGVVGLLALCAAGLFLSGASCLASAFGLLRDAKRVADESQP